MPTGVVQLTRRGKTRWSLSLPASAGIVERFAADELKKYVAQMSGARPPDARKTTGPFLIRLGLRSGLRGHRGLPGPKPGHVGGADS